MIWAFLGGFAAAAVVSLVLQRVYMPASAQVMQDLLQAADAKLKRIERIERPVTQNHLNSLKSRLDRMEAKIEQNAEGGLTEDAVLRMLLSGQLTQPTENDADSGIHNRAGEGSSGDWEGDFSGKGLIPGR